MSRLHGGDGTRSNGWWLDDSAAKGPDSDCYEIPPSQYEAPKFPRGYKDTAKAPAPAHSGFDFNDNDQPLPWNKRVERPHEENIPVRRFTHCADRELLSYLAERSIAPEFLREIDLFLQGHPEISSWAEGRELLRDLSSLSPLEAYTYFLKGYTRPARYLDGIIKTEYFHLPRNYNYVPLGKKYDSELVAFFSGFEYRHDLLDRIDREVLTGIDDLDSGRDVPVRLRKLISYAVWGNPVDAYKFYEYSYQQEFMPHRYLPDHVILGHVPKPDGYTEPRPSDIGCGKKHTFVRLRMARAQDQGVDVLDVLLTEYKLVLLRKSHRRVEIDKLCATAKDRLDAERRDPTGADIVDMIMDDAAGRQDQPPRRRRFVQRNMQPRKHTANLSSTMYIKFRGGKHRMVVRRGLGYSQVQGDELRRAKSNLQHLYEHERDAFNIHGHGAIIGQAVLHTRRATAERRYVNCLIRYLRAANRMTPIQANSLNGSFTREKMSSGMGMSNENYLMSMYPYELN